MHDLRDCLIATTVLMMWSKSKMAAREDYFKEVLTVRTLLVGMSSEETHSLSAANKTYLKMERITGHI